MTSDATAFRSGVAGQVLCVIEADVEGFFKAIGKAFAGRIAAIHGLMANRAHRNIRRRELRQVTTSAIFVAGKFGRKGYRSMMTARAEAARTSNSCKEISNGAVVCL
jgi:thioredoxin reductase